MQRTKVLSLPIFDNPKEDLFKIDYFNTGFRNIENIIGQVISSEGKVSVDLTNQEVVDARGDFQNLRQRLEFINSVLSNIGKDITSFGITGDGTDETEKIQEVLDGNSGVIIFPKGKTFIAKNLVIKNPNTTLLLIGNLKCCSVKSDCDNTHIIGNGGDLVGLLKYVTTTKETAKGSKEVNVPVGHGFNVGDYVQCSYGIGGDGSNPIKITNVTDTSILLETETFGDIPIGARIANYQWSGLIMFSGNNSSVENLFLKYSQGYAISIGSQTKHAKNFIMKNVIIDKNGLDLVSLCNADAKFYNCSFLENIDCAKQGIVFHGECSLKLFECLFNRHNCDMDFTINGGSENLTVEANNCKFIGSGNIHPAPYNSNSFICFDIEGLENDVIKNITFNSCSFEGYSQGVIGCGIGNKKSFSVEKIHFIDCTLNNCVIGNYEKINIKNFYFDRCEINNLTRQYADEDYLIGNNTENFSIIFNNCTILNDRTYKQLSNCYFYNCKFIECDRIYFTKSTKMFSPVLINSKIISYPFWDNVTYGGVLNDLLIQYDKFTDKDDITSFIALNGINRVLDFKFINGTLKGKIYCDNYKVYYKLYILTVGNKPCNLIGDDWKIPFGSLVENVTSATISDRFKTVTKSNCMKLSSAIEKDATQITVNSTENNNSIGDYVNILLDDNTVFTTKISSISDSTITLEDAVPSSAKKDSNVCVYLY